jgi:hypothetical protein
MQVEMADSLRAAVPASPQGKSTSRRKLLTDDFDLIVDARGIRDVYQAWLIDPEYVDPLEEVLEPWLNGDVVVTIAPIEDTNKPLIFLEFDRPALTQLPGIDGNLLRIQELAPLSAALGSYRQSLGTVWPGFLPARIKLKISFPPYSCTFEDNRLASTRGDVLHACVEMNGREHCGTPDGGGARFNPEAMRGLEVCVGGS